MIAIVDLGPGPIPAPDQPSPMRSVSRRSDLDRLLTELGHPVRPASVAWPSVNPDLSPVVQGQTLAGALRRRLKLEGKDSPYSLDELAGLLERRLGVDVAFLPLPEGLDGLALSSDNFRLALVSTSIFATRQRFTPHTRSATCWPATTG